MTGTLYGLGVGPGDPELITLKALRYLKAAPVLAYPAPETGDSMARQIIAPHLPGNQIEVPIRMPMVEARFPAQSVYEWAAKTLGEHLDQGRDVAVLCEGDPFLYGSFMYLFARMADDYAIEVVPGVSSVTACAAASGAPLASRHDILTIVPATLDEAVLRDTLAATDAAAIMKVGRHLEKVRRVLSALDLAASARYVEHATMQNERLLPINDPSLNEAPYFSMILVHRRGDAWRMPT